MTTAKLYTDSDGDLLVALDSADEPTYLSYAGKPVCRALPAPNEGSRDDLNYLATIPEDRARLYIEHGCTLDDYEIDRAIWAAAYAHEFATWLGDAESLDGYCREGAKQAVGLADITVLARWKAKS